MGYLRHTTNRHRKGHRVNGYPNDVLAPDGVAEYGWRLVRKDGVVKFVQSIWQDNKLLPFVGQYIVVKVTDVYCIGVTCHKEYPNGNYCSNFICQIGQG